MRKRTIVYKNLNTGAYFVQPYAMGPVAATEFGEPTPIRPEEFESRIANAVTDNLEKFGMERYDKARAILRTDKQQLEFLGNHVGVSISERGLDELAVYALHREGGGMVGSDIDTFIVPKKEVPRRLASVIYEAFKRAT